LEKEIDLSISNNIFLLLVFPLFVTLMVTSSLTYYLEKINKKNKRKSKGKIKKPLYKYYVQETDYKIKEIIIGEKITIYDIEKHIDYDKLKSGGIICCGINKKDDFVEVSFFEKEYLLRIYKNGDEKSEEIEATDDYSIINEVIYKNII